MLIKYFSNAKSKKIHDTIEKALEFYKQNNNDKEE